MMRNTNGINTTLLNERKMVEEKSRLELICESKEMRKEASKRVREYIG